MNHLNLFNLIVKISKFHFDLLMIKNYFKLMEIFFFSVYLNLIFIMDCYFDFLNFYQSYLN